MTTLTIPNCDKDELNQVVGSMSTRITAVIKALQDGYRNGTGTAGVDGHMNQIGHAGLHIFLINFSPLNLRDGRGGGHALGGAHHLIELVVGHVPALQIFLAVQIDGEPNDN